MVERLREARCGSSARPDPRTAGKRMNRGGHRSPRLPRRPLPAPAHGEGPAQRGGEGGRIEPRRRAEPPVEGAARGGRGGRCGLCAGRAAGGAHGGGQDHATARRAHGVMMVTENCRRSPRGAGGKRHRQKHPTRPARCDQRAGDLAHAFSVAFHWSQAILGHHPLDVFDNDDGVIDKTRWRGPWRTWSGC